MKHPRLPRLERRRPWSLGTGTLALLCLVALGACSTESEQARDRSEARPSEPATLTVGPTDEASSTPGATTGRDQRTFGPTDYTYRLELVCYCALPGPVEVTVSNGAVASAVETESGKPAADWLRLSIADILERAAAPAHEVVVTWPTGKNHPTEVRIDKAENTADDETTYLISDVRIG